MSFLQFFAAVFTQPLGAMVVFITLGVLFVNGWTDAPNAIASGVTTGAMTLRQGILLAAAMNLLGGCATLLLGKQVAEAIYALGAFTPGYRGSAALAAAMLSVILWAIVAWRYGIPTSESHALMAGLMGSALALGDGGVSYWALGKVLVGLVLSIGIGFLGGWVFSARFQRCTFSPKVWRAGQWGSAALMAFAHGAQDTPKFASILILGMSLWGGTQGFQLPLWMLLLCSGTIGLGTLLGGGRIIRTVGSKMVRIEQKEGFAADLAGSLSLLLSTLQGLPVSTTHVKTTALMGASLGRSDGYVDRRIALSMFGAWALTFPVCGLLSYLLTSLLLL